MGIIDLFSKGKTALKVAEILSRDYSLEISVCSNEMKVVNGVTLDVLEQNKNANENDLAAVFLFLIIKEKWDFLDREIISAITDNVKKNIELKKFRIIATLS
jgi:hypothetical protein